MKPLYASTDGRYRDLTDDELQTAAFKAHRLLLRRLMSVGRTEAETEYVAISDEIAYRLDRRHLVALHEALFDGDPIDDHLTNDQLRDQIMKRAIMVSADTTI